MNEDNTDVANLTDDEIEDQIESLQEEIDELRYEIENRLARMGDYESELSRRQS